MNLLTNITLETSAIVHMSVSWLSHTQEEKNPPSPPAPIPTPCLGPCHTTPISDWPIRPFSFWFPTNNQRFSFFWHWPSEEWFHTVRGKDSSSTLAFSSFCAKCDFERVGHRESLNFLSFDRFDWFECSRQQKQQKKI